MPLVNRTTNLKSLRYGSDRRNQGSSNQPYVTTPIPNGEGPGLGDVDFLLRGGSLLPASVVNDVSRLTQMMFDFKSPNGVLFTVKQNALSRSAVNQMAVSNDGSVVNIGKNSNRLPLNNGIYLPTSTLAQAAVNPLGGHLLKQGINPFASTNDIANGNSLSIGFGDLLPLSNPLYIDTAAQNERQTGQLTSRLISFTDSFIKSEISNPFGGGPGFNVLNSEVNLYSYSGGPGSTLGVGKTIIPLSKDRTGVNNPFLAGDATTTSKFFNSYKDIGNGTDAFENYSVFTNPRSINYQGAKIFNSTLSKTYEKITNENLLEGYKTKNNIQIRVDGNDIPMDSALREFSTNVFETGSFKSNKANVSGLENTLDYDQLMTAGDSGSVDNTIIQDFRQNTPNKDKKPKSIDYADGNQRLDGRVNHGSPGLTFTDANPRTSYVKGRETPLDKINALQIYKSDKVDPKKPINDLVKFRIGVIDNNDPNLKTYIHFRAFINSMNDSYSADWGSQRFSGRAENLYNYQGFDRSVSLSWTVAAQSKQELMPMYQKLNYLASVCAPDYSSNGYMRGNLIELTVGGYLYNQVGIMKGINYGVPAESPWEIGINDSSIKGAGFDDNRSDPSVKEMPFIIDVSGFEFIPIHNFVPNIQKNIFASPNAEGNSTQGDLVTFGLERYISLSDSSNNNYNAKLDENKNNIPINIQQ
tara:strand:+ start:20 stop:2110 length:2091 start_codon:yes stop_codon:yes gene_type:complete